MIHMRAIADGQFERRIDLIVATLWTVVALDQHGARIRANDDQRTGEHCRRTAPGTDEDEMDRSRKCGALPDLDYRAIAHERGVERNRHIVGGHDLAQKLRHIT